MIYAPDDFVNLSNAVEHEGGKLLLDPCVGRPIRYKLPRSDGKLHRKTIFTTRCDLVSRMMIPYDASTKIRIHDDDDQTLMIVDHDGEKNPKNEMATVCAVDDCLGLWPRFQGVISNESYQQKGYLEKEAEDL